MPDIKDREPLRKNPLDPWLFIRRALKLRCPECGISPIFRPWRETRSTFDWFAPLDGCPRCGYGYQREQGYFLLSIWGLNYGLIAGLATVAMFTIEYIWAPPMWVHLVCVVLPLPFLSFLFARHSKALFLALDHYCDPHLKQPHPTQTHGDERKHA